MLFAKQKELSGHSAAIYSLAFVGHFLYSASGDHYVTRWDITTGVQDKFAIKFDSPVYSICLFKDKFLVAGLSNGNVHFFDLEYRKEVKFITQHKVAVFSIIENRKRSHIYISDADGNLSVWDSESLHLLLYMPFDCGKVRNMTIDETGDRLVLCGQDGTLRILDCEYFNELESINAHNGGATAAVFHPLNENMIISGGKDAHLKLWDINSGNMIKSIPAHNYVIYDLLLLNRGKTLISASRDKTIKIWNLDSLGFLQRLDSKMGGHKHSVNSLIRLTDHSFASTSDDKRMIIWEENSVN